MKKTFIDAYIATFGGTKKNANEVYKNSTKEYRKEVINGFFHNAKIAFYND